MKNAKMLVKVKQGEALWIYDGKIVQCFNCNWYDKAIDNDNAEVLYREHIERGLHKIDS